jgi:uncharacterized repeat protein (TIGR01451 family)
VLAGIRRVVSAVAGATASEIGFTMRPGKRYRLVALDGDIWYRVTSPAGPQAIVAGDGSTHLMEGEGVLVKASGTATRVSIIRENPPETPSVHLVAFGFGVERVFPALPEDLGVTISDSVDPVLNGSALSYTVTLSNSGAVVLTGVSAVITLDPGLQYVDASGTGWSCSESGGVVTCTRATAAAGASPAITIETTVTSGAGTLTTSVDATAAESQPASADEQTTVEFVTLDATSGIYAPANAGEWTSLLSFAGVPAGNPSLVWNLQEASGNVADSIGSFTGTVTGAPTYEAAVTGWSRKAIHFSEALASGQIANTAVPNLNANSFLVIAYAEITATPSAVRYVIRLGTTVSSDMRVNTTPRIVVTSAGNVSTGTQNPTGAVRPFVLRGNRTGTEQDGYTDQEKLSPAFGATLNGQSIATPPSGSSPPMKLLYVAAFYGANAERSDADVKSILETLGWTIPWS